MLYLLKQNAPIREIDIHKLKQIHNIVEKYNLKSLVLLKPDDYTSKNFIYNCDSFRLSMCLKKFP